MADIIERGNIVETLAQALRNIGPGRLLAVGGVGFALIIFFVVFVAKLSSPSMEELYSQLDASDTQRVVSQLGAMGIKYEVKKQGGQILVPGEEVARIRMQLADQGLPGSGVIGYEIFDNADSLGTTNFLQNVTYIRALEGELGRTVESLNTVKGARVHLVLPKRELFSRERRQPSASVFLRMRSAVRLSSEQVSSIQHLIAAAVPSLIPSRISIIDNKGKLLAAGFEDGNEAGALSAKADEKQRGLELRLSRTIEELLEQTVGFGRVRAEVHAEMDFDRISTQEETFNPDGQVVGSTQAVEETSNSNEADGSPSVSVGTNLPDANLDSADNQSSSANAARTEETTNFLNSKKVTNHIRQVGLIKRITVAVLVDGIRFENEDGDPDYKARPVEDLELLETLVRGAIGFNADRGDQIDIINMEFDKFEEPEPELDLIFGLDKNDMFKFAQLVVLAIVALLVIMLVVRPIISRAFEVSQSAAQAASERMLADQAAGAPALAGPGAMGVPAPSDDGDDEEQFEELIDIDRVEGRVKASSVKKVGEIVEKHPEEAISIIRAWMYQET
jgi:flagellar M-ring protein FliF